MPFKKTYKKPYRKKAYHRRRYNKNRSNNGATNTGVITPIGRTFKSTMKYCSQTNLLTGVGALQARVISANGLFDPDITGVGHQPMGFDQIMPLYDHYCVIGSTGKFTFDNTGSETQIVGVLVADASTGTPSSASAIMEQGTVRWMTLEPAGSSGSTKTMTIKCNPNKYLGKSKPMSDDVLQGTASANPQEQVYFKIFAVPFSSTNLNSDVDVAYQINYTSIFHEPKTNLAQS